jgi:hypothetical protein
MLALCDNHLNYLQSQSGCWSAQMQSHEHPHVHVQGPLGVVMEFEHMSPIPVICKFS